MLGKECPNRNRCRFRFGLSKLSQIYADALEGETIRRSKFVVVFRSERIKTGTKDSTGVRCNCFRNIVESETSSEVTRYTFTDTIALAAMKTIWTELPKAYHEPRNREAREAMMQAATLAGIAFSNSSVALVHGMSRPIGAFFHVAHGLSNAMLLPAVTAYSVDSAVGRYADCARALGITAPSDSDNQAVAKLVKAIFERNAELQVPSPRKYGIAEKRFFEAIPTMAAQALASGSPQNNPRVPIAAEIEELYREVWA
jgi:alcohol dehydrogenase class IV